MAQLQTPKAEIDPKTRLIKLEQPHPILVDSPQRIIIPFAALKQLVAQIMMLEAQAEFATGDPTAVPGQKPAENGRRA